MMTAKGIDMAGLASTMRAKLIAGLEPSDLVIEDQSALHAGHAGARPGGETHFAMRIVSARFRNQTKPTRHRMVYQLLATELAGPVHALSLTTLTPEEFAPPG